MNDYRPNFSDVPKADSFHAAFCGPSVIAVLTGLPVERIEYVVASRRKMIGMKHTPRKQTVTGMFVSEILSIIDCYNMVAVDMTPKFETVIKQCLATLQPYKRVQRPTVFQWLNSTAEARGDDVYLIVTRDHVLLVSGDQMVDSWYGGKVRNVRDMRFKKARIEGVYCILKES